VLYDNMKTVVLERDVDGEGEHRYHAGFLDYARHCGFVIKLCRPYRARTKGKVERFNGYLRRSFYVPLVRRSSSRPVGVGRRDRQCRGSPLAQGSGQRACAWHAPGRAGTIAWRRSSAHLQGAAPAMARRHRRALVPQAPAPLVEWACPPTVA
jgi:hypothetical protein